MKKIPIAFAALLATALLAGCILYRQPIHQGNLLEKKNVEQLQVGMNKRQVLVLLGSPSVADPFHASRWDYITTQRTRRAGKAKVKHFIAHFEGDNLARWEGEYFPEQDEMLAIDMRRRFGYYPKTKQEKEKERQRRAN